jgi:AraC-like DNA-binding protein
MSGHVSALLQAWRHTCRESEGALVLPDGCQDLIGEQFPGQAPSWKLSPLMDRACRVAAPVGQRYVGYRLLPGAQINVAALLLAVKGLELDDSPAVLSHLDVEVVIDGRVNEALQSLASERDVRRAQRQLGVSERTLERLLRSRTGRTPVYWKRLARLRGTARNLGNATPLAELAAAQGYSDQAHMNLEFRHWLGMSPAQVRQQGAVSELLGESGYA